MKYKTIIEHYENCFERFGDSPKGVDWTKEEQVDLRYKTMLELINYREKDFDIKKEQIILDYGCGLSHLYRYILAEKIEYINYTGLEISEKFYHESKKKYPGNVYILGDILDSNFSLENNYDYIIMNGVFTEKRDLDYDIMFKYFERMIIEIYKYSRKGVAFNVMSKYVDWEVETLFHVPFDDMALFLTKYITRNFVIRNDYGLYEYTVYLYK